VLSLDTCQVYRYFTHVKHQLEAKVERTDVIVMGGGICGLLTALLLAKDGNRVLVLEGDATPAPADNEEAWTKWDRSIPQFHQTHNFHPLFRHIIEAELPDVLDEMRAAGALKLDGLDNMPATITDRSPRPRDDRFWMLTGRRPVMEACVARVAARESRIDIRWGVKIRGLLTASDLLANGARGPRVTGVLTADGHRIEALLVVDALGRRSPTPDWLSAAGSRSVKEESDPWGFTYYTRFFTSPEGQTPQLIGSALNHMGRFSILTFPADNGHYSITLFASSADTPFKALRDVSRWTALVGACPQQAHWLDGVPVSDVLPMAGVVNRRRHFFDKKGPIALGILPVGDAWASTNPSLGRGISLGLKHAIVLRDAARKHLDDPAELASAWHFATRAELDPWYEAQVAMDRSRFREMEALRTGVAVTPPEDSAFRIQQALLTARFYDPDAYRAFLEITGCLARPEEVLAKEGMVERVLQAAEGRAPISAPSPSRDQVLQLLS
jgi:2-polyprenyl-6-methoxyphenol hydroxylase-like FAD-dependent oxidoreductase